MNQKEINKILQAKNIPILNDMLEDIKALKAVVNYHHNYIAYLQKRLILARVFTWLMNLKARINDLIKRYFKKNAEIDKNESHTHK